MLGLNAQLIINQFGVRWLASLKKTSYGDGVGFKEFLEFENAQMFDFKLDVTKSTYVPP